jgi:hypothetical protein
MLINSHEDSDFPDSAAQKTKGESIVRALGFYTQSENPILGFATLRAHHVFAGNSCALLIQVCCTVGNAYHTLGRERDPCVYNSEPHQAGRK